MSRQAASPKTTSARPARKTSTSGKSPTAGKTGKTGLGKKSPAAARSAAKGELKASSGKKKVTSKITLVRNKAEKPATKGKERLGATSEAPRPKMGKKALPAFPAAMEKVLKTLDDRKVEDLCVLQVTDLVGYTDFLIIGTGLNTPHVQSMADAVIQLLKIPGVRGVRSEGYQDASWVLVDGGDFVVHLFQPEARKYYALEELWGDAPAVSWP